MENYVLRDSFEVIYRLNKIEDQEDINKLLHCYEKGESFYPVMTGLQGDVASVEQCGDKYVFKCLVYTY